MKRARGQKRKNGNIKKQIFNKRIKATDPDRTYVHTYVGGITAKKRKKKREQIIEIHFAIRIEHKTRGCYGQFDGDGGGWHMKGICGEFSFFSNFFFSLF